MIEKVLKLYERAIRAWYQGTEFICMRFHSTFASKLKFSKCQRQCHVIALRL